MRDNMIVQASGMRVGARGGNSCRRVNLSSGRVGKRSCSACCVEAQHSVFKTIKLNNGAWGQRVDSGVSVMLEREKWAMEEQTPQELSIWVLAKSALGALA